MINEDDFVKGFEEQENTNIRLGNWFFGYPISKVDKTHNIGWIDSNGYRQYFAMDWNPMFKEGQLDRIENKLITKLQERYKDSFGVVSIHIDFDKLVTYTYCFITDIGTTWIVYKGEGKTKQEAKLEAILKGIEICPPN